MCESSTLKLLNKCSQSNVQTDKRKSDRIEDRMFTKHIETVCAQKIITIRTMGIIEICTRSN